MAPPEDKRCEVAVQESEDLGTLNSVISNWAEEKVVNKEEIITFYNEHKDENKWIGVLNKGDWRAPEIMAQYIIPYLSKLDKFESLLDVGAGTGPLGVELRKRSVPDRIRIDALEPSVTMQKSAKEHNIYTNFYSDFVTGVNSTSVPSDSYDALCTVGTLVPGHLPVDAIYEFIRIVRPGGLIALITRTRFITEYSGYADLIPTLDKLETEGVLEKLVLDMNIPFYMGNDKGICFIYRKIDPKKKSKRYFAAAGV